MFFSFIPISMSILQLAITDCVYILDLMVLYTTHGAEELLKTFFFQFFTKRTVTKVGEFALCSLF